jgi:DNA-binding response OmpR family regulator
MNPAERSEKRRGFLARILLVEDHEPLAAMRQSFLTQQGYEVVCARDGQEGCRLLESEPFDLVVTDSALPKRSGWEVATIAKRRHLPVILSSGWPVRLRPEQMAMRGVDFVAPKPCTLGRLLSLVETALEKGSRAPGG